MDIGLLKIDVSVNIQRTDGRIHAAIISSIDEEKQVVVVEWVEKEETKGKEIDILDIKTINPSLFPEKSSRQSTNNNHYQNNNNTNENTVINSVEPGSKETLKSLKRPETTAASKEYHYVEKFQQKQKEQKQLRIQPPKHHLQSKQEPPTVRNNRFSSVDIVNTMTDIEKTLTDSRVNKRQTINTSPTYDMNNNPNTTITEDSKKPGFKKKSSCVKEVEKIQQRRAQRRAHHVAVREQYESVYDTSVPNWEFEAMIKEYRSNLEVRPLVADEGVEDKQICVCLRKRPLNKKELSRKEVDVVTIPSKDVIVVHEPKTKVDLTKYLDNQSYRFDYAFDENSTNETIYRYTAKPLVECTFQGGMATCFAYGQTGSGKTHTMGGDFTGMKGKQDCSKGIYVLAAMDVFELLNTKYKNMDLVAGASFFEIYSGKVFDLLNDKKKLKVMEDGRQQVQIVGLQEEDISDPDDVLRYIQHGNSVRTSGQTSANLHSSRSHAVFQIILRKRSSGKLHGKFSLIDLAGNERGADTMDSERSTRMEGAEINKSLLALKECIRALGRIGAHLPFRASKLTQVLRDSFIGDKSRTCMIAMISPGVSCCEHTLNTLRYADRVKELEAGGGGEQNRSSNTYLSPTYLAPANPNTSQNHHSLPSNLSSKKKNHQSSLNDDSSDPNHPSPPQQSPSPSSSSSSLHDEPKAQKSDLAILKSSNGAELPDDLYEFHEAVDRMREMEDEVVEEHKDVAAKALDWVRQDRKLITLTDAVDYDVESYAKELNNLLQVKITSLQSLNDKVKRLREEMAFEIQLSRNIKKQ